MQLIKWRQFLENGLPLGDKLASMTIGVFDGVHRGHQALIERIVSRNANTSAGYVPVVFTFRQNHKTENKEQRTENSNLRFGEQGDIQSFEERLAVLERLGVQITVVIDFSEEFRRMRGIEFLKILLEHGNAGFFAVGSDFRCGYQLDTDASAIKKFFSSHNIPVEIVPQVMQGTLPVSSSRIRAAIAAGDHTLAQAMLGGKSSST